MKYAKFTRKHFGETETAIVKFNTTNTDKLIYGWVENITDFHVIKPFNLFTTVKTITTAKTILIGEISDRYEKFDKYEKFVLDIYMTINDVEYGLSYEINLIPDEVIDIPEDDNAALLYFNVITNN